MLDRAEENAAANRRGEDPVINISNEELTFNDLRSLPEFNPPRVMPQGNVGTPMAVFMELIRACKLPAFVIRKLKLEFPKSRSKRRYGAVPPVHVSAVGGGGDEEETGNTQQEEEEEEEEEEELVARSPLSKKSKEGPSEGDEEDERADDVRFNFRLDCFSICYRLSFRKMMTLMQKSGIGMKHCMKMWTSK